MKNSLVNTRHQENQQVIALYGEIVRACEDAGQKAEKRESMSETILRVLEGEAKKLSEHLNTTKGERDTLHFVSDKYALLASFALLESGRLGGFDSTKTLLFLNAMAAVFYPIFNSIQESLRPQICMEFWGDEMILRDITLLMLQKTDIVDAQEATDAAIEWMLHKYPQYVSYIHNQDNHSDLLSMEYRDIKTLHDRTKYLLRGALDEYFGDTVEDISCTAELYKEKILYVLREGVKGIRYNTRVNQRVTDISVAMTIFVALMLQMTVVYSGGVK